MRENNTDLGEPLERTEQTEVQSNSALGWKKIRKQQNPEVLEMKKQNILKIVDRLV